MHEDYGPRYLHHSQMERQNILKTQQILQSPVSLPMQAETTKEENPRQTIPNRTY